nr:hypothetical protein [Pedobacter sp. ASV2]
MKQKILLAFSLLAGPVAVAQNTFPNSGNVGIGTTSPQYLYQMMGEHNSTQFNMRRSHGNPLYQADLMLWASEPGISYTGVGIGNNVINGPSTITRILNAKGASYMRLLDSEIRLNVVQSNGTDIAALAINSAGNVGIGTEIPRVPLDVGAYSDGGKLSSVLSRLFEGDKSGDGTFLGVKGYATTIGGKSFALEHSFYGSVNSSVNFYRGSSITGGEISFNTDTNLERVRIDVAGNVGIGTATPREKLSVNGNISVNGKIGAKEVKVEGKDWPDYVFAKNYVLPTLAETEKYINKKGHLPGMPSAMEVESNGLAMSEMFKLQQQKIEELTLYIIQQQKDIDKLKKKLNK